jgi:hypothetical protein
MAIEKYSTLLPRQGQAKPIIKKKLLTALGATGVLAPFPQNPEHIIERKILLQNAFNTTGGGGGGGGGPNCGTVVTSWAAQVVANGGVAPSAATQLAMCAFVAGMMTDGIWSRMIAVNAYAPDNLIAGITPILQGPGSTPWFNQGFSAPDLTVNGLVGDGTKVLIPGIIPATAFTSFNYGFTIYISGAVNEATQDMGIVNSAITQFIVLQDFSDGLIFDSPFDGGAGVIGPVATPGFTGYLSGNRTDSTHASLYRASSGFPHASIGSVANTATDILASLTYSIGVHALLTSAITFQGFTTKRLSFAACHLGLSQAQSALFFARIQTLRQALGGGFA